MNSHLTAKIPEPMTTATECIFCKIACGDIPGRIVERFDHCFVIRDGFPVSPGHILIIPYEHTENWFTASEDLQLEMIRVLNLMKEGLDKELHPDGYNVGLNCGKAAGQTVMHLHLHLIPRYAGDMEDPRGGIRGVIPSKQRY